MDGPLCYIYVQTSSVKNWPSWYMRGAEGGILTIKRAGREDKASSESKDEGETWHTHSAGKTKEENNRHN